MRIATKLKFLAVALGLWTGAAAYIVETMRPGPPQQDVQTVLKRAADLTGLDPVLLSAVAWQESHHGQFGCSKAGACGVMQLMPAVVEDAGGIDVNNPVANIFAGAELLAKLMKRYHGNTGLALAAYNWGPASLDKWRKAGGKVGKMPGETRDYVQAITGRPISSWLKAAKPSSIDELLAETVPLPVARPTTGS